MQTTISSDSAISSSSQDLLGRAEFARNVATTIATWHGEESLVVALSGDWGVGKTSIKNMIVEALRLREAPPQIVEFEPWRWPSDIQISEAFFREIRIALGKLDVAGQNRKMAQKWMRYVHALRAIEPSVESAKSAIPGALATLATASFFGVALGPLVEKHLGFIKDGLVLLIISAVFLLLKGAAFLARYWFAPKAEEPDVETARAELRCAFAALDKPLLVIIDDIDRITPKEIRTVFRHVKANGNFPNLTFLLVYQRSIVEAALQRKGSGGAEFLQKIVQVSLSIPMASHARVERVLVDGINNILGKYAEPEFGFDNDRWSNIYLDGMQHFIRHLRDAYRLLNALSVTASFFKGKGTFEVNPLDLLALESLRVFEPGLYEEIRRSKQILTSVTPSSSQREDRKREILNLVSKATAGRGDAAIQIIRHLFPGIDWAFELGFEYTRDDAWRAQQRICTSEYFDRYFYMSIPDHDISTSELNELIEETSDAEKFRGHLDLLHARNLRSVALSRLDDHKKVIPLANARSFIPAILSIGEFVDDSPNWVGITEFSNCWRITYWYLLGEQDAGERAELISNAMQETGALAVPSRLILNELDRQKKEAPTDRRLLEDADLAHLKSQWLENIRLLAYADPLNFCRRPRAGYLLSAWAHIGDIAELSDWTTNVSKSDLGLILLLHALATPSLRSQAGSPVSKTVMRFELDWVSKFADTTTWAERIGKMDRSNLSDIEQLSINAYLKAERARRGEESDDDYI